jgi:hypothetical protein
VTGNLQGWTRVGGRQGLAGEKGPSPDTVVKASSKEIILGWGNCVRLEYIYIYQYGRIQMARGVAYEARLV